MMHTLYLRAFFVLLWLSYISTFFGHPLCNNHNTGATVRLVSALEQNDPSALSKAIDERADINFRNLGGDIPLIWVCSRGYHDCIGILLQNPYIQLDIQNKKGDTALIIACKKADYRAARQLLSHRPNLWVRNKKGKMAYDYAVSCRKTNLLQLICSYMAIR